MKTYGAVLSWIFKNGSSGVTWGKRSSFVETSGREVKDTETPLYGCGDWDVYYYSKLINRMPWM